MAREDSVPYQFQSTLVLITPLTKGWGHNYVSALIMSGSPLTLNLDVGGSDIINLSDDYSA